MRWIISLTLGVMIFSGCAGSRIHLNTGQYVGLDKATLVQELGIPDRQMELNGRDIYEYELCDIRGGTTIVNMARPGWSLPVPVKQRCNIYEFILNDDGIVIYGGQR